MDLAELKPGLLVKWTPPPHVADAVELYENHPGEVVDPDPRDVGVSWAERAEKRVSIEVYDYRWLTVIDAKEYENLRLEVIRKDESPDF